MLDFSGLNWLAILVATLLGFALGGVWYGPLFGKAWLAALGKAEDEIQPSATPFIVSLLTTAITASVLATLYRLLGLTGAADGAVFGMITGIGFIAASMASDHAFGRSGVALWGIQAGYRVVYTMLMGAILAAWG